MHGLCAWLWICQCLFSFSRAKRNVFLSSLIVGKIWVACFTAFALSCLILLLVLVCKLGFAFILPQLCFFLLMSQLIVSCLKLQQSQFCLTPCCSKQVSSSCFGRKHFRLKRVELLNRIALYRFGMHLFLSAHVLRCVLMVARHI